MDSHNIAYLAGFFDGEGCIHIQRIEYKSRTDYNLKLRISNNYKSSLLPYQELFSGPIQKDRRAWQWVICAANATKALHVMLPYLRLKRAKAVAAIAFYQNHGGYLSRTNTSERSKVLAYRKQLYEHFMAQPGGTQV